MKRIQLIEWGIIAIALIFGYKFFESMISFVMLALAAILVDDSDITALLITFIVAGLYFAALILIVRNSHKIAVYLNGPGSAEDTIPLTIGKQALLQVVLIAMCAFTVLTNIADIIYYLFETFKDEAGRRPLYKDSLLLRRDETIVPLIISAIQILIAIIVISYSKKLAFVLVRKNDSDEIAVDSNPQS